MQNGTGVTGFANLHDYVAIPGKIISIPGTDYVVITPDTENNHLDPLDVTKNSVIVDNPHKNNDQAAAEDHDDEDVEDVDESEMLFEVSETPPTVESQLRRRGRPAGKSKPSQVHLHYLCLQNIIKKKILVSKL